MYASRTPRASALLMTFFACANAWGNCIPTPPGAVGWWPGDGQPLEAVSTNHGILAGSASYTNGVVGQAFRFELSEGIVRVPDAPNLNPTNELTLESWIYVDGYSTHNAAMICGKDAIYKDRQYLLGMVDLWRIGETNVPNSWVFRAHVGVPGEYKILNGRTVIAVGRWHHVAMTYDNAELRLYLDGKLDSAAPLTGRIVTTPQPLLIGGPPPGHGWPGWPYLFKGRVDELALYNRALSSNEIAAIHETGAAGKCQLLPSFLQQPQSRTNVNGQTTVFSTVVVGSPSSYRWFFDSAPLADNERITGANSNTLVVANLSAIDAGNYHVVASNTGGSVTSAIATLTVMPCAGWPNLVHWWQADGNGNDSAYTNTAALLNGTDFTTGKIAQAFSFDGVDDAISVPASTSLDVGSAGGFTVEFWFNPALVDGWRPLIEWNDPSRPIPYGVHLWIDQVAWANAGSFWANIVDTSGGTHGVNSGTIYQFAGVFRHVALSYDQATGIAALYLNGVVVGLQNVGTFVPQTSFPFYLGHRPTAGGSYYQGLLDEIGIYNRALTPAEVLAIYESGTMGKCPLSASVVRSPQSGGFPLSGDIRLSVAASGSQPLSYQWYFNGTAVTNNSRVTGATGDTLIVADSVPDDAGDFIVVVRNEYGCATSTVATVSLGNPPTIIQHPLSQSPVVGGEVALSAQVSGDEPLVFRWHHNNVALADDARHFGTGTTNLVITNLTLGDSGAYTIRTTNAFGSITSSAAVLTVITPPNIATQPRGYSVPVGLPVTLGGAATGTAPLFYQWLLNGDPVTNATNATYAISNLLATDIGDYQLVVTNLGGATTSSVAPLTVGPVGIWGYYSLAGNVPIWPGPYLTNVISIAAGSAYSLALRQDGTVYGWGYGGSVTNIPAGLHGVVAISAGPSHAVALLSNGLVQAWGAGPAINVPLGLSNVVAVSAGSSHEIALRSDGTVVVWGGSTFNGQTNVPLGLIKVAAIDAGSVQSLALREDGMLIGWGKSFPARPTTPATEDVPADLGVIRSFAASPGFDVLNIALLTNGSLRTWGATVGSNLPNGLSDIQSVELASGLSTPSTVALALRSNRTVAALGLGGYLDMPLLTNVPPGLSNVVMVSGGSGHVLALVDNGLPAVIRPPVGGTFHSGRDLTLTGKAMGKAPLTFQWLKNGAPISGANSQSLILTSLDLTDAGEYELVASNELGVARSVAAPVAVVNSPPVFMSQPQSAFAYYGSPISFGASVIGSGPMSLVWLRNGTPTYSDTNDLVFDKAMPEHGGIYQLVASNAFGTATSSVAQITFTRFAAWGVGPGLTNAPVDLGTVLGIASGNFHAIAILSNRTVAAWGTPYNGATNVPSSVSNVMAIAAGSYFSVALKSDGTVEAWGLGSSGQTNAPVGLSNIVAISAGGSHALALRANGTVAAWGLNSSGQISIPANLSGVVAIAAGATHSLALTTDAKVIGWGQFGTIPAHSNVVAIAAGYRQSVALQADGRILAWSSTGGSTGLPEGISNVVAISASGGYQNAYHAIALKSDGTLVGWGNNSFGQLNWPREIKSAIAISAGGASSMAYLNDRSAVIVTQPFNRHSVSGSSPVLVVLAAGEPFLAYQWQREGTNLMSETSPTLTLTNVSRAARGHYSALVTNPSGESTTRALWLDVVGPVRLSTLDDSSASPYFRATDGQGANLTSNDVNWLEVQASTNLLDWQILSNALTFTNGALILVDEAGTNSPQRFYRLIER